MPITDLLIRNAEKYPNDPALVELNPEIQERHEKAWKEYELVEPGIAKGYRFEITWREFNEKANRFANHLKSKGYGKGNRVAILLMNCLEWLPLYFGILKTGALVVPMNFRYTAEEIKYCLELAEADALVFGPEFTERVGEICNKTPRVKDYYYVDLLEDGTCPDYALNYDDVVANASIEEPNVPLSDDDDAAIYFSSGTTGFPKAILHTHASLLSACHTEQNHHGQTKDDVFLCIPPLYHTGAKMHWFGSLMSGGKGVILRGVKPRWILRAASEEGATIVWLLVPWAQDILDSIKIGKVNLEDYQLDSWRLMHIGAQPVPPSLIKRWLEVFPGHKYDTNYGLSESAGPGCVHLGVDNISRVGAIGVPGHNWQAKIVDENGAEVEDGKVGELIVKGPGLMKCYYRDEEATAASLKDGWLYTGDMAKKDDGFIYLVDRKKDVIICGGENIYPVQIEDFLHTNEDVKDVAVIGLPDHRLGEITAAIIELKEGSGCTEEDMAYFCKALPRYKRPRRIIFAEVPRNLTGKIEKPKLRQIYCGESLVETQTKS